MGSWRNGGKQQARERKYIRILRKEGFVHENKKQDKPDGSERMGRHPNVGWGFRFYPLAGCCRDGRFSYAPAYGGNPAGCMEDDPLGRGSDRPGRSTYRAHLLRRRSKEVITEKHHLHSTYTLCV